MVGIGHEHHVDQPLRRRLAVARAWEMRGCDDGVARVMQPRPGSCRDHRHEVAGGFDSRRLDRCAVKDRFRSTAVWDSTSRLRAVNHHFLEAVWPGFGPGGAVNRYPRARPARKEVSDAAKLRKWEPPCERFIRIGAARPARRLGRELKPLHDLRAGHRRQLPKATLARQVLSCSNRGATRKDHWIYEGQRSADPVAHNIRRPDRGVPRSMTERE